MMLYLVFVGPTHMLVGLHRTIDGATHAVVSEGATAMPDKSPITIAGVRDALEIGPSVTFSCDGQDELEYACIERHGVYV